MSSLIRTLRVSAKLTIKSSNHYDNYESFVQDLSLILDRYDGLLVNRSIHIFLYVLCAIKSEYRDVVGRYNEYEGSLNWIFKLNSLDQRISLPDLYQSNYEDSLLNPTFILKFESSIEETKISPIKTGDFYESCFKQGVSSSVNIDKEELWAKFGLKVEIEGDTVNVSNIST